uniref:Solute carrier family 45 member 3 n=1 Tax=Myripristis murdjan TaxID=586833 RepID=A0A668ABY3_9TELE
MASVGLFLQCVVSVLCSALVDRWVALLGARAVYSSSAALLVLVTAVMTVSSSVLMVTVMAALTGYIFCVLQVLPYTLLCFYHSDRQASPSHKHTSAYRGDPAVSKSLFSSDPAALRGNGHPGGVTLPGEAPPAGSLALDAGDGGEGDSTPVCQRGICFDMAILDSAYLLSQVLPAMCLGSIVQQARNVRAYMASAFCFSLLAFVCSTRVVYSHADLHFYSSI